MTSLAAKIFNSSSPYVFTPKGLTENEVIISIFLTNPNKTGEVINLDATLVKADSEDVISYPIVAALRPRETKIVSGKLPIPVGYALKFETDSVQYASVTIGLGMV
jgi:hypothetical protein